MSKPRRGEKLQIYLAISEHSLSSVLVRDEQGVLHPVYYVSKRFADAESRYPELEKLALALLVASRKLRHYFQAHQIEVLTDVPLRTVLSKPEESGRLMKWAVELSQFGISYRPRSAVKGQALADFIAEFSPRESPPASRTGGSSPEPKRQKRLNPEQVWPLHVDGASNGHGAGGGLVLVGPGSKTIFKSIHFSFAASNNEAEYEALLAGLREAEVRGARVLNIFSDSQLIVGQVTGEYQARDERMKAYLAKARLELAKLEDYEIEQISRESNGYADALAKLGSCWEPDMYEEIPVQTIRQPSIATKQGTPDAECLAVAAPDERLTWMTPIRAYLSRGPGALPEDKNEARRIRMRSARYTIHQGALYRRGYSAPLLRCIDPEEGAQVLTEIHEGDCGNHTGGQSLAYKTLRLGYYWPNLKRDARAHARRCQKCQTYAPVPRAPAGKLNVIHSPWPFAKWGIDLIGPLHTTPERQKYAIVAVDYFTKWAEAAPLTVISEKKCTDFIWRNIVCRFGVPHTLVSDNGLQFDNANLEAFCNKLGINHCHSSVSYPQSNGQVEAVNKILKTTLKRTLEKAKGRWAELLPSILWAYRTTRRASTGETPYSMSFGMEAVLPVEVSHPTARTANYDEAENSEAINCALDLSEEVRLDSQRALSAYQARAQRYYNKKVHTRTFSPGDLVLRKVMQNTRPKNSGALGPSWEGPYIVSQAAGSGAYRLKTLEDVEIRHTWNAEHLKTYYP